MGDENIKITQDPKILIQQILGKVLGGKEDRVTINVILIGNAGTMVDGKKMELEVIPQKTGLFRRLFGKREESMKSLPEPVKSNWVGAREKYHISKEALIQALESTG